MTTTDVEMIEKLVKAGFPGTESAFKHVFITSATDLAKFILSSNRQEYIIITCRNGWFLITEVLQ